MQVRKAHLCILVKAYPQPSQKYEETVCCAGVSAEGEFLRLYPIPYRRLKEEQRFGRFDVIEAEIFKDGEDWRLESYKVNPDSIRIVQRGSKLSDIDKVALWSQFVFPSIEALKAENLATSKSLGIVAPTAGSVRFFARAVCDEDTEENDIFASLAAQARLFESEPLPKLQLEYTFGYRFSTGDNSHEMKIHDWEVQAAYHNYKARYGKNALHKLHEMYGEKIPGQNLHFILGTMKGHPRQFIIIGLLRSSVSADDAMRQSCLFG